jgi:hypothetical protein
MNFKGGKAISDRLRAKTLEVYSEDDNDEYTLYNFFIYTINIFKVLIAFNLYINV